MLALLLLAPWGCSGLQIAPRAATWRPSKLRGALGFNGGVAAPHGIVELKFDHVQIYASELQPLRVYKALEDSMNARCSAGGDIVPETAVNFAPEGRDIVAQMLTGLNWRITAAYESGGTANLLVSAPGVDGARFVVTAPSGASVEDAETWASRAALDRHAALRKGKAGFGVLGFAIVGGATAAELFERYSTTHKALLLHDSPLRCGSAWVVEAYAYYAVDSVEADRGTVLRFIQNDSADEPLAGLGKVPFEYNDWSVLAVSDHWVSNVFDRPRFVETLTDVLGFLPRVEFESGVVAAGEAVIESTVPGNDASLPSRQVFLPVNNAVSNAGHVAAYLEQRGQGVQHVASRVQDLVAVVSRANALRTATGEGIAFLEIPRSYYGYIASADSLARDAGVDCDFALKCLDALRRDAIVDATGVVLDLEADLPQRVFKVLKGLGRGDDDKVASVSNAVGRSRYRNLFALLGDALEPKAYLELVRNCVLVDRQGDDVLYQIFTRSVLQAKAGEEAPFLEFIQRVCGGAAKERAGCGGFGIRNFLTLFLSIELNKAQAGVSGASNAFDADVAKRQVECLQRQLDASNPILTAIAKAVVDEVDALTALQSMADAPSTATAGDAPLQAALAAATARKHEAQQDLKDTSAKYAAEMRALRLESPRL